MDCHLNVEVSECRAISIAARRLALNWSKVAAFSTDCTDKTKGAIMWTNLLSTIQYNMAPDKEPFAHN